MGIRYLVFLSPCRSRNPFCTSFSIIPARVAGVPSPLRSASSGISFAPAVSMLCRSVSSVKCFGGTVFPSFISTESSGRVELSFMDGSTFSFSFFFLGLHFSSIPFHPAERTVFPFALKTALPQRISAVVSAVLHGSLTAVRRRWTISLKTSASPFGSSDKVPFCNSFVEMIA